MSEPVTERQEMLRQHGENLAAKLQREADWISKSFARQDLTDGQRKRLQMQSETLTSVANYISALQSDWEECYGWIRVFKVENDRLRKQANLDRGRAKFHQKAHIGLKRGVSQAYKKLTSQLKEIESEYGNAASKQL